MKVKGTRTPRRPTESTHLGPQGLTETGPSTKEHAGAGPKYNNVQLGIRVGLLIIGVGVVFDFIACHWIPFH